MTCFIEDTELDSEINTEIYKLNRDRYAFGQDPVIYDPLEKIIECSGKQVWVTNEMKGSIKWILRNMVYNFFEEEVIEALTEINKDLSDFKIPCKICIGHSCVPGVTRLVISMNNRRKDIYLTEKGCVKKLIRYYIDDLLFRE